MTRPCLLLSSSLLARAEAPLPRMRSSSSRMITSMTTRSYHIPPYPRLPLAQGQRVPSPQPHLLGVEGLRALRLVSSPLAGVLRQAMVSPLPPLAPTLGQPLLSSPPLALLSAPLALGNLFVLPLPRPRLPSAPPALRPLPPRLRRPPRATDGKPASPTTPRPRPLPRLRLPRILPHLGRYQGLSPLPSTNTVSALGDS